MANLFAYPVSDFLTWVAGVVRAKGVYITRTVAKQDLSGATKATADIVVEHIQAMEAGHEAAFQPTEDDAFFAEMALEQARNPSAVSEYAAKLKEFADKDTIDLTNNLATGILASAVGVMKRQHENEKLNADMKAKGMKLNEYFGDIRQRATFLDAVVLTDTEQRVGNYGGYTVAKVATAQGHWLVVYGAPMEWQANQKVNFKATVRKQFEDKTNTKWTMLGSVRALTQEEANKEFVKADRKAKREAKAKEPKTPEEIQKQLKAQATRERKKAEKQAAERAQKLVELEACEICKSLTGPGLFFDGATTETRLDYHQRLNHQPHQAADMNQVSHG